MVSAREKIVRTYDDETLSIVESARRLSLRVPELREGTIRRYISAKRNDYSSHALRLRQYKNSGSLKQRTMEIIRRKYGERGWYRSLLANRKGFESEKEKEKWRAQEAGFNTSFQLAAFRQNKPLPTEMRRRVYYLPPFELDNIVSPELNTPEKTEEIECLIKALSYREQKIIMARFYDGRTLKQVGEQMKLTREGVRRIEVKALGKMRRIIER